MLLLQIFTRFCRPEPLRRSIEPLGSKKHWFRRYKSIFLPKQWSFLLVDTNRFSYPIDLRSKTLTRDGIIFMLSENGTDSTRVLGICWIYFSQVRTDCACFYSIFDRWVVHYCMRESWRQLHLQVSSRKFRWHIVTWSGASPRGEAPLASKLWKNNRIHIVT